MRTPLRKTCTTGGCQSRATHLLEYNDDSPLAGNVRRVHDQVCEECGNSYMRTYRWERRLTDGTTTRVAEKRHSVAGNGGGIPGFQSREWAGQFLYDHEWPTYIRRD